MTNQDIHLWAMIYELTGVLRKLPLPISIQGKSVCVDTVSLEFPLYGHAKYRVSKIQEAVSLSLHYLFKV